MVFAYGRDDLFCKWRYRRSPYCRWGDGTLSLEVKEAYRAGELLLEAVFQRLRHDALIKATPDASAQHA
jgi:hypothetical protein